MLAAAEHELWASQRHPWIVQWVHHGIINVIIINCYYSKGKGATQNEISVQLKQRFHSDTVTKFSFSLMQLICKTKLKQYIYSGGLLNWRKSMIWSLGQFNFLLSVLHENQLILNVFYQYGSKSYAKLTSFRSFFVYFYWYFILFSLELIKFDPYCKMHLKSIVVRF